MKKYRLKKRNYINWIIVLIFIMIALIFVNIGYSLWSTRLNIFGNVTLLVYLLFKADDMLILRKTQGLSLLKMSIVLIH